MTDLEPLKKLLAMGECECLCAGSKALPALIAEVEEARDRVRELEAKYADTMGREFYDLEKELGRHKDRVAELEEARDMPDLSRLVDRFLAWPLPATVNADPCASMPNYSHRTGTNLLTATEAEAMLRHVLSGKPRTGRR